MADFGIGTASNVVASNVAGPIIGVIIQKMKDMIEMEENLRHLKTDFTHMEYFLVHIENQFRQQQRALPQLLQNCLERMHNALQEANDLIVRAEAQPRCLGCCSLRNPKLSTQIRDWKTGFDRLFEELEREFSVCALAQQIVSAAAPHVEVLLQPIPDSGFVGSTIESAQMQVQAWLGEAHPQARMVGIYGMGGVGKTSLLKLVYNHFKDVSGIFDIVIWVTISQQYQIEKLQASIAETLHLKLEGSSDNDKMKMKLSASLREKKFLLILDDLWRSIDLNELGVKFGDHNCSKVLMSSRSRDVVAVMGASDNYSLRIQPLSTEDGWVLFRREAFTNGVVPNDIIEAIGREIASKCQGLPLALNAVAAAMRRKRTEVEWRRALTLMTNADPSFRASHSTIDADLYQRLRWSYNDLPNRDLQICFLYCAVFPEDAEIPVETLVEMWSAEKLVTLMDAGHEYIDVLVDRGLFEYVAAGNGGNVETIKVGFGRWVERSGGKQVKVHDVIRDLAIYIGKSEENWLFAAGQYLTEFPKEDEIRDCKRISVGQNDIQDLPTDLICPDLVSLVLASNESIREVPTRFFSTAMSLRVLDLSHCISITSLPTSLGHLGQLEFLKLTGCYLLENLPESTGNLSRLRFLNLEYFTSLNSLPDNIGNLRNLKHLSLEGCHSLMAIPHGISHLTSLNKLFLPDRKSCPINVEDIANLSNLMELRARVRVKPEIKESTMTTWTDLTRLDVRCVHVAVTDVAEDIFPFNMENVKKLEHFSLHSYEGVSLPSCVSQFQNLRTIYLSVCPQLRELPACKIRNGILGGGFPMLKRLNLRMLDKLESMVGSSVVSSEETMPELEDIEIRYCRSLKRLGIKKLPSLKKLDISDCREFEALEIETGGLTLLEDLSLSELYKFQTIVGPSGVINEGVMPKLQVLIINYCPLLRRLVLEKLPNLRYISIWRCRELRELQVGSGGLPMLERLELQLCEKLENIVGLQDVWDDKTMPKLQSLKIRRCPLLRRLPRGMEKLSMLQQIIAETEWWQKLFWENENVERNISRLFSEC